MNIQPYAPGTTRSSSLRLLNHQPLSLRQASLDPEMASRAHRPSLPARAGPERYWPGRSGPWPRPILDPRPTRIGAAGCSALPAWTSPPGLQYAPHPGSYRPGPDLPTPLHSDGPTGQTVRPQMTRPLQSRVKPADSDVEPPHIRVHMPIIQVPAVDLRPSWRLAGAGLRRFPVPPQDPRHRPATPPPQAPRG